MRFFKKIQLHTWILIGLVLGAVFGAIFRVDHHLLIVETVNTKNETVKTEISHWDSIKVESYSVKDSAIVLKKLFDKNSQLQVIKFFKKLGNSEKKNLTLIVFKGESVTTFENVKSVNKKQTLATVIKPIGTIFIRLLSFLAIPLVIASLIVGAASLESIKKIGTIGGKTLLLYIVTTIIAITIGLLIANIIQPGKMLNQDAKNRLISASQEDSPELTMDEIEIDIINFFVEIVPKNPIGAMSNGEMLQIVFFAVIFGVTLSLIDKEKSMPVVNFFSGVSETFIKMVEMIMKLAPFGVFALIAVTIADFGFEIITTLIWYIVTVLLGLLLQTVLIYSIIVKFLGRRSPIEFFKGIKEAQVIAFSTSSSAATLPVTMRCVENNLKIPKKITGFVLPLGATINMDGTALYQGVATVFIAQVFGFNLGIAEQLTIVITAVLASIGTAPVPGVGIIMLVMILKSVNLPPEGIALILGVDRILDM
ncbi:MAG: dicarboxylate/amino acid:cation symporter, partial [Candidatus Kapabacteria bacterium]|nr:dicarboxylate/amino acid:cation symporter [Candidatus Kapabacteria bacterium]